MHRYQQIDANVVRVVRNAETLRNFSDDGRAHLLSGMSPSVDVATESKHDGSCAL